MNSNRTTKSDETGYSLVELLVAMVITAIVIAGAYALLQSGTDFATEQRGRIQMQESARGAFDVLTDFSRSAGFGGLPVDIAGLEMPTGVALEVRNNLSNEKILDGSSSTEVPDVLENTDVLILRGSFDDPNVYRFSTDPKTAFILDSTDDTQGDLYLFETLQNGQTQDLSQLKETVDDAKGSGASTSVPEALLVSSSFDPEVYCILELDPDRSDTSQSDRIKLRVLMPSLVATRTANQYQTLCPGKVFPETLKQRLQETNHGDGDIFALGTLSVIQERRFYIRPTEDSENKHEVLPPLPMLSSARVLPGTETPYRNDNDNLKDDVATGLIDLQIELGFDTQNGGDWASGASILEVPDGTVADDWLFNHPSDDETKSPWANRSVTDTQPLFQYLRIRVVALTDQVDRRHLATELERVADHVYEDGHAFNQSPYTALRRVELVTTLDIRNLKRYR